MKKKINKIIKFKTPALTLSIFWGIIVIAFSITMFAMAQWDPPSSSPPGGNTSEPVNVSGTFQSKSGPFTVEGAWLESYNETNLSTVGSGVTIGYDPSTIPSPPDNALWVEGQVGLGTTGPVGRLHVVGDTIIQPGSLGFDADGGAGTLQFVSWDIGAGTKSGPLCTLDTSGTFDCVGGFASGGSGTITDAFTEVRDSSDVLQFSATGEDKLQFGAGPGLDPVGYDATNNRVTFGLLSSCAPDQVLKWDDVNSNWICADDVGSTGSGIGLTGAADQTIRYDDVAGDWVASGSLLNTGSLVEVVSGQDTMLRLNRSGTADNTEFRVGTDGVLVVNADAADTLFLDSGNLGVGANPINRLGVSGGAAIGNAYAGSNAAPADGLIVEGQMGVGVASPDPSAQIHSSGSIFLNSGTVRLAALAGCNDDSVLETNSSGDIVCGADAGGSGSGLNVAGDHGDTLYYNSASTDWESSPNLFNDPSTGLVRAGTGVAGNRFEVSSNSDAMLTLNRSGTTDNTEFRVGTDGVLVVNADATDTLFLDSGNLGIGRNPDTGVPLHVEGGAVIGTSYTASPGNGLIVEGQVGVGVASPDPSAQIHSSGSIFLNSGTVRLVDLTGCNGTSVLETNVDGDIVCGTDEIGTGVPDGTVDGQTLRWDNTGGAWLANTNIYNAGVDVGVGTTSPGAKLGVRAGADNLLRLIRADTTDDVFDFRLGTDGSLVLANGTTAGTTDALKINSNRGVAIGDAYIGNTPPDDGLIVEGRMGIGVANPDIATSLHIAGALRVNALNCSANANGGKLTADIDGNIICGDDTGGGAGGIWTDGGATTYLTATGDNVAIGTTSTGAKFEVSDSTAGLNVGSPGTFDTRANYQMILEADTASTPGLATGLLFGLNDSFAGGGILYEKVYNDGGHAGKMHFLTRDNGDTGADAIKMTVAQNGNVGIGTQSPGDALQIGDGATVANLNIPLGGACIDSDGSCSSPGNGGLRIGAYGITSTDDALQVNFRDDINFNNNELIASYVDSGNVDHIWHNDSSNQWNFVSDAGARTTGNSAIGVGRINFAAGETIVDGTNLLFTSNSGFMDFRPSDGTHGLINRYFTGGSTAWSGWRTNSAGDAQFTASGSYSQFVLDANDNVGISRSSPAGKLDVGGRIVIRCAGSGAQCLYLDTERHWVFRQISTGASSQLELQSVGGGGNKTFNIRTDGRTYFRRDGGAVNAQVQHSTGNIYANAFFYSSDRNLKENIQPITGALDKVLQLEGMSYDWKNTGRSDMGLVAQDVREVFPELVHVNSVEGEEDKLSLDYGHLSGALVEAIKEQQTQIDSLESDIEMLKAEIEKLK